MSAEESGLMARESGLVRQILEYFAWLQWPVWRMNSGLLVLGEGASRRVVRGAPAGTADIIGIIPARVHPSGVGVFMALEVKIGRNKPTETQLAFQQRIQDAGGIALVVYSLEDVISGLESAGVQMPMRLF